MPPRRHIFFLLALGLITGISCFSSQFDPYYLDLLIMVGVNIILAVSLNLISGHTGQFSLGHAGFMAIGAYLSTLVTVFWSNSLLASANEKIAECAAAPWGQNLLFLLALLTGGLCAAIAGLVVGGPSLRLRGDYLALVTLGFGEIVRVTFQNTETFGGALGMYGLPDHTSFFWVYATVACTLFVVGNLTDSTWGRGFPATRDDEIAASSIGINPTRYKIIAFVVGAFFAGVAGALFAHFKMTIVPTGFDFTRSIEIVVMVILGGMGNTRGVILAAILLTLLPEFLRPIAQYRMVLYALLLIVLMILRPQGLFNFRFSRKKSA